MSHSNKTIGVLGGGQLGRMIALEGRRMGFRIVKWTGGDVSGAAYTADRVIEDPFDSDSAFAEFVDSCEVVTVEFENVPSILLQALAQHLPVMPGASIVAICQNREREKTFLADHHFPCARFEVVENESQLHDAARRLNCDLILKTAEFGYDGKGQQRIERGTNPAALTEIWNETGFHRAVAEEVVPLAAELSVLVARATDGSVVTYDPAENIHRNHILDVSIVPARLPEPTTRQAQDIAVAVAEALDYRGLLGVEFFLATDGRLLVNELAPRPHNSGHHTLDACHISQFEQQLRVVSGMPLGSPQLIQSAVMWNLMGDLWTSSSRPPDWTPVLATPGAKLHLYGKSEPRPGRKMGHVTFLADDLETALHRASTCRRHFGLPSIGHPTDPGALESPA